MGGNLGILANPHHFFHIIPHIKHHMTIPASTPTAKIPVITSSQSSFPVRVRVFFSHIRSPCFPSQIILGAFQANISNHIVYFSILAQRNSKPGNHITSSSSYHISLDREEYIRVLVRLDCVFYLFLCVVFRSEIYIIHVFLSFFVFVCASFLL
ncbi:hypothetical protein N431DRAFT_101342 [Stipitochalara longipes BDJ]|nr:hypothetical protein N431DRAFT_101342 [Stipitochalara longipes BDJ]